MTGHALSDEELAAIRVRASRVDPYRNPCPECPDELGEPCEN